MVEPVVARQEIVALRLIQMSAPPLVGLGREEIVSMRMRIMSVRELAALVRREHALMDQRVPVMILRENIREMAQPVMMMT